MRDLSTKKGRDQDAFERLQFKRGPQSPGAIRVSRVVPGESERGDHAPRAVEGAPAARGGPGRLRRVADVVPAGRVRGALK